MMISTVSCGMKCKTSQWQNSRWLISHSCSLHLAAGPRQELIGPISSPVTMMHVTPCVMWTRDTRHSWTGHVLFPHGFLQGNSVMVVTHNVHIQHFLKQLSDQIRIIMVLK